MKDKTLDELMDMPVTDELKQEVSKRVFLGEPCKVCGGAKRIRPNRYGPQLWECCKHTGHFGAIPDSTRPENFWPLLWKMMLNNGVSLCAFGNILELEIGGTERDEWLRHTNPGLAVAFAYLKIEEQANDTTADT